MGSFGDRFQMSVNLALNRFDLVGFAGLRQNGQRTVKTFEAEPAPASALQDTIDPFNILGIDSFNRAIEMESFLPALHFLVMKTNNVPN